MTQEDRLLYMRVRQHYGDAHQIVKAIEELSELQKELCKVLETAWETDGQYTSTAGKMKLYISAEMADVYVMLEQLMVMLDNAQLVSKVRRHKLDRLISRLNLVSAFMERGGRPASDDAGDEGDEDDEGDEGDAEGGSGDVEG